MDLLAAVQARRQEGRLRRHALRRSAQAAGDGAGAHERPPGRHARRADGRGEPGADPEPARPRQGPARAGHDGDLRRARHGRRPGHQRLGRRHGRRPDHRRGAAGVDQPEPGRRRRLPRGAPRRPADRRGGGPRPRPGGAAIAREESPTATSSARTAGAGEPSDRCSETAVRGRRAGEDQTRADTVASDRALARREGGDPRGARAPRRGRARARRRPGRRVRARASTSCGAATSTCRTANSSASSGRTVPASRRCSRRCSGSSRCGRAR